MCIYTQGNYAQPCSVNTISIFMIFSSILLYINTYACWTRLSAHKWLLKSAISLFCKSFISLQYAVECPIDDFEAA